MRPTRVVALLAAVAGVVVAHAVDYVVVFPHAGERAWHLSATGHAYWPVAAGAAVGAGAAALLLVGARSVLRLERATVRVGSLLAGQAGAFVAVEVSERAVMGVSPIDLLASTEIWLGLLLQVPVAYLASRLLGAAGDVAERAATVLAGAVPTVRPRRPGVAWPVAGVDRLRGEVLGGASRPRAPPLVPSI